MHRRKILQSSVGILGGSLGTDSERSPSSSYSPFSELSISGTEEAIVDSRGETVFIAVSDGFAIVDIHNPNDPKLIAEQRNLQVAANSNAFKELSDVKVNENRLLVVGPSFPVENTPMGVLLYDVSKRDAPKRLAFYETNFPIHNGFIHDGRVYLTGNNGEDNPLVILDVSSETFTEIGRWSIVDHDQKWSEVDPSLRKIHDIWVQDERAYIAYWDAGTWIVDVSNPHRPTVLSKIGGGSPEELAAVSTDDVPQERLEPPGNHHYVTVDDDASILGVGIESWDLNTEDKTGGVGWIELWDISTGSKPHRISRIDPPTTPNPTFDGVWTTAHNFDITDNQLYTAWYRGGVTVHDISEPSQPERLASWRDSTSASFWTAQLAVPNSFFIASSWEGYDGETEAGLYTFPDVRPRTPKPLSDLVSIGVGGSGYVGLTAIVGLGILAWRYRRSKTGG